MLIIHLPPKWLTLPTQTRQRACVSSCCRPPPPLYPPHNNNRRQLRPLQMALASATELQGDQTRRQRERGRIETGYVLQAFSLMCGEGCWTKPKNMIKNEEVMSKTLKKDYYGSFWSVLILWPFLVQFIHLGMVTISGSTLGLKGIFFWLNLIVVGFKHLNLLNEGAGTYSWYHTTSANMSWYENMVLSIILIKWYRKV